MQVEFSLKLPRDDVAIGIVVATGVSGAPATPELREATEHCVRARQGELEARLDGRRQACRDMLRNGRYKPTGRGKPASEYLLREAAANTFPSINHLVDANNLVSLEHLVPISLWDVDLAASDRFLFRLGTAGERYEFNRGGQVLELEDLIVGCALDAAGRDEPLVNPIKDSLKTKTREGTTRVAAAIYCPLAVFTWEDVRDICRELCGWLAVCTDAAKADLVVLMPNSTRELRVA